MDNRVIGSICGFPRPWSIDIPPIRTVNASPPFRAIDGLRYSNRRIYIAPENEGPAKLLCLGRVAGVFDKFCKLSVGDRRFADPERL